MKKYNFAQLAKKLKTTKTAVIQFTNGKHYPQHVVRLNRFGAVKQPTDRMVYFAAEDYPAIEKAYNAQRGRGNVTARMNKAIAKPQQEKPVGRKFGEWMESYPFYGLPEKPRKIVSYMGKPIEKFVTRETIGVELIQAGFKDAGVWLIKGGNDAK